MVVETTTGFSRGTVQRGAGGVTFERPFRRAAYLKYRY
jgi:hypothetical protein